MHPGTKPLLTAPDTEAPTRQSRHSRLFSLYRQEAVTNGPDEPAATAPGRLPTALSPEDITRMQEQATSTLARPRVRRSFWQKLRG